MTDQVSSEYSHSEGHAGRSPRVSVVIPVYNAEATLEATLRSVVDQTYRDFEIVICDDGSRDRSREMAREILAASPIVSWQILHLGGFGAGGTRNQGIAQCRGEFIAFLDDDDAWEPEKLALCVQALDRESLDLVCHAETWMDEKGRCSVRRYSDLFDRDQPAIVSLMRNNPFSTSAVVVRRDRLEQSGGFDETLPSAEDYDLWIQLVLLPGFRVGFIDRPLGVYLVREGSESSRIERRQAALLAIGDRYRDVLRAASPWGGLEYWKYRAKTVFTSGLRYMVQGQWARGFLMAARGLGMWPFRFDWLTLAAKRALRRRTH